MKNKKNAKYNKYIVHFFSKTLGGGCKNNPVKSTISDQNYFNTKYDKNASTRACFSNFLVSKITHSKSVARCEAIIDIIYNKYLYLM